MSPLLQNLRGPGSYVLSLMQFSVWMPQKLCNYYCAEKMSLMLVNRNIHIVRSVCYYCNCYSTLFGTTSVSSKVYTESIMHHIQSRRKYTCYFLHLMLYTAFKLLEFTFPLYPWITFLHEKMEKMVPEVHSILQEGNQLFKSSFTCVCKSGIHV